MTIAAKHFDPQLGIDIHAYSVPPGPYPTPYIGLILDPFDYIPVIGATLEVNGIKQATAGTGGFGVHIPMGVWTPPIKTPGGPQYDDAEVFMGSMTVLADGEPFSTLAMPVLDCNIIGMVPPFRLKKVNDAPLSMTLPTALNLSIPTNVFVGGPPMISMTAMAMKAGFAAFGKFAKKFKLGDKFKAFRQKLFKNMDDGFLKCNILRAEPVDIRNGSVSVEQEDFTVPGRLPLVWTRRYSSDQTYAGVCGHGWQTPADIRLELDAEGIALFHDGERVVLFPELPILSGIEHAVLELINGARLFREHTERGQELVVRTKDGLLYRFTPFAPMGTAVSPGVRTLLIERIEDAHGNFWRFERHSRQLVRIVESGTEHLQGRFIEASSRNGRIQRMQLYDPATGLNHPLTTYRYNIGGDLVAALDALEGARTFCYDRHRMLRHTDRIGQSFYYAYDKAWRVVHAWGDHGLYDYHFSYDDLLRETEIIDSLGNISRVKFDENLLPLCEIDPLDGVTIFEYDDFGRTIAVVDPEGLRTEFEHDDCGNLLKLTRPDGSVVANEYDAENRLIAMTDPDGHQWRQVYDELGLLREQIDPLGATARYDYDHQGQLLIYTNPCGAHTHLAYDRHGLLLGITDALGEINEFRYDPLGRLLQQANALNQYTEYEYDAKGRLLRIIQPNGTWIHCEYDAEDRLIHYVDEAGAETYLEYVGLGRISKRIQPDGHVVEYHYDTEEQLIALTNQRGERYQLIRDPLGRIIEEVDYWGQSRHYHYDAAGRLCKTIDPLGQTILFESDKLGRITKKTLPDIDHPGQQMQETFIYNRCGQLTELHNRHRQIKRKFDASGRLIEEDQDGFKVTYRHDGVGNRIERSTSAGNTVTCSYDPCNRVTSIQINDEAPITLQRDALGRVTNEQLSANVSRLFQYDNRNLLTTQTVLRDASALFETRYGYDRAGNLAWRDDTQQGQDSYQYDVMGRLLAHTDPKGKIARFLNDPAGDRLKTRTKEVQLRRVANGEDYVETRWTREGTYENVHYVFDRAGDLIRRGDPDVPDAPDTLHLTWDANHRLTESRKNDYVTTYGYDPLGRRVFKRNPTHTTWFYWDGDALLGEARQANDEPDTASIWTENVASLFQARQRRKQLEKLHERIREYVYYPDTFVPLALISSSRQDPETFSTDDEGMLSTHPHQTRKGKAYACHYHVDLNGCPTRITNAAGHIIWSARHSSWGMAKEDETNKIENPIRLQGQYLDSETGLAYTRSRYYESNIGQWIGMDPLRLLAGENLYGYGPNVFLWIDPLGLNCGRQGERIARQHLENQGYDVIGSVQNRSGHGIDLVARDNSGALHFFEVKTTSGTRVPRLSAAQAAGSQSFVTNRLQRAATGQGAWGAVHNPNTAAIARGFLSEITLSGGIVNGHLIKIALGSPPGARISISPW